MDEVLLEQLEEYEVESKHGIEGFITDVEDRINEEFSEYESYYPATLGKKSGIKLYSLVREMKPEVMVETGVCNGFSSSVILKAMEDNDKGKLYSVDLPVKIDELEENRDKTGAVIPPGKDSGWAVPEVLRDRWDLFKGDTYYETPKIFEKLTSTIDIFLHDSGHSYETMMFEFALAWKHLREDGILLADNIDFSEAFMSFSGAKALRRYHLADMGLLIKKDQE